MIAGLIGLAVTVAFVGQGNVRHVEIFWAETVEQTIVFEEINGETQEELKEFQESQTQHYCHVHLLHTF